jgi:hypothetical protein
MRPAMIKSMMIVVFCVILLNLNFAQDNARIGTSIYVPALLPSIQIDAFNSIGFSNITNSQISEIGSSNPAVLGNINGLKAGLSFQYNTDTDYVLGLKLERAKQWIPSGFGIVYPQNDLRFGLGYHQKYSNFLDFGKIAVTTVGRPDGTGEFYEASDEIIIHSPSALISYSFTDLIFSEDKFILGGQLFWDFWEAEDRIYKTTATINTSDISWKVGLKYDYNSEFGIGVLFEKGIDMKGEVEIESDLQLADPIDTTGYFASIPLKYIKFFKLPDKMSFGFHNQIFENVLFSSNLTLVFWNSLNKSYEDQLDFSTTAQINLSESFDAVFGLYFTDRKLDEDSIYFHNPRHATFYNLGLKAAYDNFVIIAEYLNTTEASAEYREQSIFKLGLNLEFND